MIFAGVVFGLFGGGLPKGTATRVRHRAPVASGVNHVASEVLVGVAAPGAPGGRRRAPDPCVKWARNA
ncbi:hypothetical protein [Streptomyces graminilatus]|uniref:hypothetical protein n=1 Tax=Streptomyces graminilatus TaxID=1464070 RepID=UPI0006E2340E|nr:hypothetical protein [Streptomyces graminilatus]